MIQVEFEQTSAVERKLDRIVHPPEWVLITDSDEFLVYNYIHADQEDENNYELFRGKTTQDVDMLRLRMIPKRKRLPALQRHVTVADWLSVENEIQERCWRLVGLPMSSYDSDEGLMDHDVPKDINASHLMTLRFRMAGALTPHTLTHHSSATLHSKYLILRILYNTMYSFL
jgi:hypothetical protein